FSLTEGAEGLSVDVEYCTDLYEVSTIVRMADHYEQLLQSVVREPARPVGDLPFLREADLQELSGFNMTDHRYAHDRSVVDLFEAQVERTAGEVAVVYEGKELSYRDLDARSNQVANSLLSKGIVSGSHIGLLSHRGPSMIIGMLGILKAGCCYVPLNTAYPGLRLRYILEDAGVSHIVCGSASVVSFCELEDYDHSLVEESAGYSRARPEVSAMAAGGAYIMYTSGTTGHPKGIRVAHRNIVKLVEEPGPICVRSSDRMLQWSNYSFDGSVYEIYSSLLKGGRLYLIRDEWASDVFAMSKMIVENRITMMFVTTALFNAFVDEGLGSLGSVRKLLFGGEQLSLLHVRRGLSALGTGRIVHVYGPTETTVYASYYEINEVLPNRMVPIGRGLSNTGLYILDEQLRQLPVGVSGEIYIGGDGLSEGYINKVELTAEKYVEVPGIEGRVYRTGDLGRWQKSGDIEFQGRMDEQVKLRGYRIEPGEVEAVLRSAPGVEQCVVVAREDVSGQRRLVGYVVPGTGSEPDRESILAHMRSRLPEYMVPAALVGLDRLPLTANGKVDRKSLPAPEQGVEQGYVAPRNEVERRLSEIWERILYADRIGIHQNFFEAGGHSLLAMQLIAAIKEEWQIDVPVKLIFRPATICLLAEFIQMTVSAAPDDMTVYDIVEL
ncbi:MAG TPA: amino acid adenylation domain-containing protein, partial [Puia sp.]|nr:amino acid adenylation domain-containing protein [Puia sp.]